MKRFEPASAAIIALTALIAMIDSFKKSGWTPTGPDAGWYPFWSGAMMGIAALAVLAITLRAKSSKPLFDTAEGARAFWVIAIPMVIGVAVMNWIGFYLVSAGYMGLSGRILGKYRWLAVIALTVGVPLALYLSFEVGFKVPLPKSLLYNLGVIPF